MKVFENQEMKNYSNMRVGGKAKKLIILKNKEDIIEVFNDKENTNIFFLGNGTNVLFTDDYMDRTFVCTKKLNKIENLGNNLVKVETGANLKDLTDFMRDKNYSGIEEIFDKIVSVEVFDENHQIREIKKEDLKVAYRKTEIQDKNWLVLSATFKFDNGFDAARIKEIKELRESKHPLDKPSLGSTFKNPEGDFAARLISECGLKGTIIGNAQIAEKHPNFVLNLGNATFKDITDILTLVKKSVLEKFGIKLEEEIIIVR